MVLFCCQIDHAWQRGGTRSWSPEVQLAGPSGATEKPCSPLWASVSVSVKWEKQRPDACSGDGRGHIHGGGEPVWETGHILDKGRGPGPRGLGNRRERGWSAGRKWRTGGALHVQVGPIPLFDLGSDLKMFPHLSGSERTIPSLQICEENISWPRLHCTLPAKSLSSVHSRQNIWTPGKH